MDHYIDMAEKNGLKVTINDVMTARIDWDMLEDRFKQFRTAHNFRPADAAVIIILTASGRFLYFIKMTLRSANEFGAVFLFRTEAVQLIKTRERLRVL
jgi:hypothetical protein